MKIGYYNKKSGVDNGKLLSRDIGISHYLYLIMDGGSLLYAEIICVSPRA
jgi:hypothetical protein